MSGVRVLVGTRKGAFILSSDGKRQSWKVDGPHFPGWEVYHVKGSPVAPNRLYASQCSSWFGQVIQRSDDGGVTWNAVDNKFTYEGVPGTHMWYDGTPHPWEFKRVWHLEPSLTDADVVYAGVEDAAIFKSADGGASWAELAGLRGHGSGPRWQPGAGGLCLHTIVQDPTNAKRMFVAISAAGAFRTEDGGETWTPINKGLRSEYIPDPDAEVGHCVHRIAMHPSRPNTLFMQKHWDVMRSDDGGDNWHEVRQPADGLRLSDRSARQRARDDLRRADHERLAPLPPRRQAARLSQPLRWQRVGSAHQRPPAEGLLREHPPRCDGGGHARFVRHLLRHDGWAGVCLERCR